MSRIHFWQFLKDDQGRPIPSADLKLYLANTSTEATIYGSRAASATDPIDQSTWQTSPSGFFEFYIGDEFEASPNIGYSHLQKFDFQWSASGHSPVASGVLDGVQLFWQIFSVDETDTDATRNKMVSNQLAYDWETHRVTSYPINPHGVKPVDYNDPDDAVKDKMVDDATMKFIWDELQTLLVCGGEAIEIQPSFGPELVDNGDMEDAFTGSPLRPDTWSVSGAPLTRQDTTDFHVGNSTTASLGITADAQYEGVSTHGVSATIGKEYRSTAWLKIPIQQGNTGEVLLRVRDGNNVILSTSVLTSASGYQQWKEWNSDDISLASGPAYKLDIISNSAAPDYLEFKVDDVSIREIFRPILLTEKLYYASAFSPFTRDVDDPFEGTDGTPPDDNLWDIISAGSGPINLGPEINDQTGTAGLYVDLGDSSSPISAGVVSRYRLQGEYAATLDFDDYLSTNAEWKMSFGLSDNPNPALAKNLSMVSKMRHTSSGEVIEQVHKKDGIWTGQQQPGYVPGTGSLRVYHRDSDDRIQVQFFSAGQWRTYVGETNANLDDAWVFLQWVTRGPSSARFRGSFHDYNVTSAGAILDMPDEGYFITHDHGLERSTKYPIYQIYSMETDEQIRPLATEDISKRLIRVQLSEATDITVTTSGEVSA
ncbi:MAG: hypothetical protein ACW99Q_15015 [Candidatus Kariarchaeaceae archaeon]|jgi:hypothetical protein